MLIHGFGLFNFQYRYKHIIQDKFMFRYFRVCLMTDYFKILSYNNYKLKSSF